MKQTINNVLTRAGLVNRNYPAIQYFSAIDKRAIVGFYPGRYSHTIGQHITSYLQSLHYEVVELIGDSLSAYCRRASGSI